MAKFASPQLKDALIEEELFERKKKDMDALKKDNQELLRPDFSNTAKEVLQDVQYAGIVARALGKDFGEREFIGEKDLQKLMMLSDLDQNFQKQMEVKLLPIMKEGRKWEDKESKNLRKSYIKKSHKLLDILSKFSFEGMTESEEIFLKGDAIFDKASAHLDFSSAVALVDKGPRKRKMTKSSGSIYFREVYLGGERGALFSLFDGFDERGFESLPSSLAVEMFRDSGKDIPSEKDALLTLESFARKADARISESVRGFCGTSATCGLVTGKKLHYINIGNNRIYGVKLNGEVHKLAGDEIAAQQSKDELYSQLKYPYLYLGGFTQRIKGKKSFRVVHTDFRLKAPYIGTIDISQYANLFIANSGVWKSVLSLKGGKVEGGEGRFSEVFSRARNPLNAMERMNLSVKSAMKEAENRSIVDDIAMLYFTV